jgi:antitoxin (DNA-binding transcriptional repressor) of toxin-antitoxin stability system
MKKISIRELHQATGRYVRETRAGMLVVTERGQAVALLKPFAAHELPGQAFPSRDPRDLPRANYDSTRSVSRDRDGR